MTTGEMDPYPNRRKVIRDETAALVEEQILRASRALNERMAKADLSDADTRRPLFNDMMRIARAMDAVSRWRLAGTPVGKP